MQQSMRLSILLFFICSVTLLQAIPAPSEKTSFRITILKSSGEPQPGIVLKIKNKTLEYRGNAEGVISFEYDVNSSFYRTAELYLPTDMETIQSSFLLTEAVADTTLYIDSPEEIAALQQAGTTFPIEGLISTANGEPLTGATVSIQGTGRTVQSDEIGLFHIEADYNHPIVIRAKGMETLSLEITRFLQFGEEPLPIVMPKKGSDRIYRSIEQMPRFPGGMKAMRNYINRNLQYPKQAQNAGIEGVVGVQFIVEKNGEITNPIIVRHLNDELDEAALHLIRTMPRWIAGKDHGTPVRCKYSIPIQFKLPKKEPVVAGSTGVDKTQKTTSSQEVAKEILPVALQKALPINLLPDLNIEWTEYFRPQAIELSWPHALKSKKEKRRR